MIKAAIFDMDGVIIDSEPIHFEADKMTMKDFGLEITDDVLNKYVGVSSIVMWTELRPKYKLSFSVEELIEKTLNYKKYLFGNKKLELIPGIFELMNELKNDNIKIGLASSSPRAFIEMILNNLEVTKFFDIIVSGEEVLKSKPSPDIFLRAAELLSIEPSECLVIEDSEHGVKAAKLSGMKCIGFKNPNSGKQDLTLSDTVVCSINEIDYRSY
jgi:beta-phosphoglucomutase family hydrolase